METGALGFMNSEELLKELEGLSNNNKIRLLRLISRISEQSYRRAVQHVLTLIKNEDGINDWILADDGCALRYEKSLDCAIGLDGFETSSLERLEMENNTLTSRLKPS